MLDDKVLTTDRAIQIFTNQFPVISENGSVNLIHELLSIDFFDALFDICMLQNQNLWSHCITPLEFDINDDSKLETLDIPTEDDLLADVAYIAEVVESHFTSPFHSDTRDQVFITYFNGHLYWGKTDEKHSR